MRLALVASSHLPRTGTLEHHVQQLAVGLTLRGVDVEVLTQDPPRSLPSVSDYDGLVVRRFDTSFGNPRFALRRGLLDHLRQTAASFDLIHTHSAHASLALAATRARPRRLVFTPHAPIHNLLRRPYGPIIRALIGQGAHILCTATAESDVLRRLFPWAANRIGAVPAGVDIAGIAAAAPFTDTATVVLTVGSLERYERMDRAIAAMADLGPDFRLAVTGDGPVRERLLAYAADLRVASRVNLVGSVSDVERYRWLRTASVVVALAEQESSGLRVREALCAGAHLVASDIPVHREAASCAGGAGVRFVAPGGSPLDVADGIREAAGLRNLQPLSVRVPTWDEVVERTLAAYTAAMRENARVAIGAE